MDNKKPKGATAMLAEYFGRKPGQNLSEFKAEIDELTAADKRELAELASAELGIDLR